MNSNNCNDDSRYYNQTMSNGGYHFRASSCLQNVSICGTWGSELNLN